MQWHDDKTNLAEVAYAALCNHKTVAAKCCDASSIHVYGHKYSERRGSAWVWCSKCGAFAHIDGIPIDSNWKNSAKVEFSKLTGIPFYLRSIQEDVDQHFEKYMNARE